MELILAGYLRFVNFKQMDPSKLGSHADKFIGATREIGSVNLVSKSDETGKEEEKKGAQDKENAKRLQL